MHIFDVLSTDFLLRSMSVVLLRFQPCYTTIRMEPFELSVPRPSPKEFTRWLRREVGLRWNGLWGSSDHWNLTKGTMLGSNYIYDPTRRRLVKSHRNFHHSLQIRKLSTFWLISFDTCIHVPALTLKNRTQMEKIFGLRSSMRYNSSLHILMVGKEFNKLKFVTPALGQVWSQIQVPGAHGSLLWQKERLVYILPSNMDYLFRPQRLASQIFYRCSVNLEMNRLMMEL